MSINSESKSANAAPPASVGGKSVGRAFPDRIPVVNIDQPDHGSGFDPQQLESYPHVHTLQCGICHKIARNPVRLSKCRDLFCAWCIRKHYSDLTGRFSTRADDQISQKCPTCPGFYRLAENCKYLDFSPAEKIPFTVQVTCSNNCGRKTQLLDMHDHDCYTCPLRRVACPNVDCRYIDEQVKVRFHFKSCVFYSINCKSCCLPTLTSTFAQHNCKTVLMRTVRELNTALEDKAAPARMDPELFRMGPPHKPVFKDKSLEFPPPNPGDVPTTLEEWNRFNRMNAIETAKEIRKKRRFCNQWPEEDEHYQARISAYKSAVQAFEKPPSSNFGYTKTRCDKAKEMCQGNLYATELLELFHRNPDAFDDYMTAEEDRKKMHAMLAEKALLKKD